MRPERRVSGTMNQGRAPLPEDPGSPIEQIILGAMAEGQFDGLEGRGKPLDVPAPGDARTPAFRVLKNAGFTPEWAELESTIERDLLDAGAARERYALRRRAALAEIEQLLREWPAPGAGTSPAWAWLLGNPRASLLATARARLEAAVDSLNASRDRALAGHLRRLHAINRMVRRLNLIMPVRGRERCCEDVAAAAREFTEAYPFALLRCHRQDPEGPPRLDWIPGEVPAEWLQPPAEEGSALGRVRGLVQAEALSEYQRKYRAPA